MSQPPSMQEVIRRLHEFWAAHGCTIWQPYSEKGRRGHDEPGHGAARAGTGAVERRLRRAVLPPRRWPLRREPQPDADAPPVPGDPQAGSRQPAGTLPGQPGGHRPRPHPPRHPLRGGQLGIARAGRMGAGLGGLARRPGDHPVHLFPAGGQPDPRPGERGDHLRPRPHRHVPAAQDAGLGHRRGRPCTPSPNSTCTRRSSTASTTSSWPTWNG
jgi:hypothetical protein